MKKNYVVPRCEIERFVPEHYIAGCYRCLNMNSTPTIYIDTDCDGILDEDEKTNDNTYTDWDFKNDCYTDGSIDAAAHYLDSVDSLQCVIVDYGRSQVPAYVVWGGQGKDYPHFVNRISNAS